MLFDTARGPCLSFATRMFVRWPNSPGPAPRPLRRGGEASEAQLGGSGWTLRTRDRKGKAGRRPELPPWARPVSRRSVLKGFGAGAVALGTGGFLDACTKSIKGSGGSTTSGKIVIGFVSPQTGALAGFASGDNFVVDQVRKTSVYKSGFKVGGKTYSVDILIKDSQSDPNRASQVTQELILQDHADLVVTSSTPETTNPVATVCETQGVPCVSTVVPWEAWYFPRQKDPTKPVPFKYTTMYFFGAESFGGCFIPMWDRIPTNKIVAGQWPNDPDGNAFRARMAGDGEGGRVHDGGRWFVRGRHEQTTRP